MIKNIIFDIGNVLMEYRWAEALEDTGLSKETAQDIWTQMFDDNLWVMHDAGTATTDDLIKQFGARFPEYAKNIEEFLIHGERMHIKRPEIWEKVHTLKQLGYGIYLLSNYSEYLFKIHMKDATFMDDIDGKLVSYEVNQVKPDRDIYETLLDRFSLDPKDCIFLDDRKENTDTAKALGIESITIESRKHLNEVLDELIKKRS